MQHPAVGEYNPYFERYISLVRGGIFIDVLNDNTQETVNFFKAIPTHLHGYRYADGKWTIKQVLLHIMDTERVMALRALYALRGDSESLLPTMNENLFADNADAANRSMESLLEEFTAIRAATQTMFAHATDAECRLYAYVVQHPTTARALGYIIIGHVLHHIQVVRERYFL